MANKNITISDVARAAGFSTMTVSRVLNQKNMVNRETRERILKAVHLLEYRPNRLARSLVTKRSTTIGLVVPDISNPFFSEIAREIEDQAYTLDYNVLLCNSDEDISREQAALVSLSGKQVDGVILCSSRLDEAILHEQLNGFRNSILINRVLQESSGRIACISLDDRQAAYHAANYFISRGIRKIALLSGPSLSRSARQRKQGYLQALQAADIPIDHNLILECQPDMQCGKRSALTLINILNGLQAFLAYNDLIAIGAMQACLEQGRKVPEDIKIIGFDDIPMAAYVTPSLTTFAYPKKEIGAVALKKLIAMLNEEQSPGETIVFQPKMIQRQTT